ncbi:MAG: Eco57I restriction-modification methylase domain-containing protein, partial [Candidatus Krumholzibacteria bacterium]|nr:Eco57I restriction-modification methylase domain-containing protein [Candidatus Krumholzibacteria bacterium]
LDKEDDSGKVIYVDGFTRNPRKQPKVPNFLFFSEEQTLDLSDAYGDKKKKKEKVRGLIDLLDSYKFTVTENTPIEEEIALDPELLGKVFENLLASYNPETGTTARKQTGSFYTPREIVNYMVDESLIAYLEGQLKSRVPKLAEMKDLQNLLREVLAYTEKVHPFDEEEVEALIDAIDTCKILDPACGSGAFPMGILHKLVFILGKLDPHNERWKQKQIAKAEQIPDVSAREIAVSAIEKDFETNDLDYGRKLYLIESCIYGVDIQPIAIQISKLRFFISLICDQRANKNKAQNCGVRPLPNLETKFVAANTLVSLNRGRGQLLMPDLRLAPLEEDLAAVRHKHFAAQRRRDKLALQKRDAELRKKIASVLADSGMSGEASHQLAAWDPYDQNTSALFFDPEWMYGITGGFDIAIANPPYVRQEAIRKQKAALKQEFGDFFTSTADLFTYFYRKAFGVLNDCGHLCFISPNKFFRAGYGKNLRNDLARNKMIRILVDFGELPVFEAGIDPTIVLAGNYKAKNHVVTVAIIKRKEQIADVSATVQEEGFTILQDSLSPDGWTLESRSTLALLKKLKNTGIPLSQFVRGRFYYGIKTGFNDAFVIDDATRKALISEDRGSAKVIQPWLRGKDIKRWYADWQRLYVINIQSSANKTWAWSHVAHDDEEKAERIFKREFPAVFRHLKKWKTQLKNRDDQGRFYWELRSCAYSDEFALPKLVYNETSKELHCLYDKEGLTINKTGFILLCDAPKCLLGILNSRLLDYFYRHEFPAWGDPWAGGRVQFRGDRMGAVRIPSVRHTEKQAIKRLVDKAIKAKKDDPAADVSKIEAKIDQLVYKLYNLTPNEIAIVEKRSR